MLVVTPIFLCLLLLAQVFQSNLEILWLWLVEVFENSSCDKAQRAHLPVSQSFLPLRGQSSAHEPSDLIPGWSGPSDLAFESRSRGIAWRFLGQCTEKKEEHDPVLGRAMSQIVYEARDAALSVLFSSSFVRRSPLLSLLCSS